MSNRYPCPNPICTYEFDPAQLAWLVDHRASPDIKDRHGVSARDRASRKRDKRWLDALG